MDRGRSLEEGIVQLLVVNHQLAHLGTNLERERGKGD